MDYKAELLRTIETNLLQNFSVETTTKVTDIITSCLYEYSVSKPGTAIVIAESKNERLLKQYCACLAIDGKSEKTIYQYKRACLKLLKTIQKDFTEIGAFEIRYFLGQEKMRGVSNVTLENTRSYICAFFNWLTLENFIIKNPCLNIKPIKCNKIIKKPFSDVEIDALRSNCKTRKERALVEFLLSSGVRISELCNLNVEDIDAQALTVSIKHGKGDKDRITYITPVTLKYLNDYLVNRTELSNILFCNGNHKRLNPGGVRYILNNIADRANVTNVHPHRFRRTFASKLASRGMKIQNIQQLLGHTNLNTTMTYVYVSENNIKTAYTTYIN